MADGRYTPETERKRIRELRLWRIKRRVSEEATGRCAPMEEGGSLHIEMDRVDLVRFHFDRGVVRAFNLFFARNAVDDDDQIDGRRT